MDFRQRAKEHRRISKLHFENDQYNCFPAACIELRMAIECIAYRIFETYADEFTEEFMDTWQPGKLIDELKEIDQFVDQDVTLSVGSDSSDSPREMHLVGTDRRPKGSWLKESYNALGNFVHERTVAQIKSTASENLQRRKQKFEEIALEVDRILDADLWNLNLKISVSAACNCGFLMTRREGFLIRDGRVKCALCGEIYRVERRETGGDVEWTFYSHPVLVKCPYESCAKTQDIPEKNIRKGFQFCCEHCGQRIRLDSRICAIKVN